MVKGVKAFEKGLICRDFQFKENESFSVIGEPEACRSGFHFCENPLDTLQYYPLIDDNGEMSEFAAVEALGDIDRDGNKVATNKIHIGAKLGLPGFIKASFDFLWVDKFEFQMLYGFRKEMQLGLAKEGYNFCTYVPFGNDWYGYFMRRLAERPQNLTLVTKQVFTKKTNTILAVAAGAFLAGRMSKKYR